MEKTGFVYVLHFDSPLHHAPHYCGCTRDPRNRLITHACGRGAKIVRAALGCGIGFTLGALGAARDGRALRRIERQVKDWHGLSQFCEVCSEGEARAIPGTVPYPLSAVSFPKWSDDLAKLGSPSPEVEVRFSGPDDPVSLAEEIKRLMQPDKDCLGYIPAGGEGGLTISMARGRMVIARVDGILVGYLAFTETPTDVKIHQIVVADHVRGCGLGRQMVGRVLEERESKIITARVRDDLPANEFWTRLGFGLEGRETHETSGHQLNIYRLHSCVAETLVEVA